MLKRLVSLRGVVVLPAAVLAGVLAWAAGPQRPGSKPGATEESYRRARQVLDAAVQAHNAGRPLAAVESVAFKIAGDSYHRNQSPKSEGPPVSAKPT